MPQQGSSDEEDEFNLRDSSDAVYDLGIHFAIHQRLYLNPASHRSSSHQPTSNKQATEAFTGHLSRHCRSTNEAAEAAASVYCASLPGLDKGGAYEVQVWSGVEGASTIGCAGGVSNGRSKTDREVELFASGDVPAVNNGRSTTGTGKIRLFTAGDVLEVNNEHNQQLSTCYISCNTCLFCGQPWPCYAIHPTSPPQPRENKEHERCTNKEALGIVAQHESVFECCNLYQEHPRYTTIARYFRAQSRRYGRRPDTPK